MKKYLLLTAGIFSDLFLLNCSTAQPESDLLKLEKTISLPNVSGRIDHIAINLKKQIAYVAALSNNTVEVVDLKKGEVIHSIKDMDEPQGIIYIPENNSIFIANGGNGNCVAVDADNYQQTHSVTLSGDADNVRYDSASQKIFVGYEKGAIAIIDAITFKQTEDIKLSGHPESFQIDKSVNKIYVNVPDANLIEVIDLKNNSVIAQWKMTEAKSNFPMALDETNHRLFIGCRHPAKMLVLDTQTGKINSSLDIDNDVDDIFYNNTTKEIYLSCGGGYIDIIKQTDVNNYLASGKISSHSGARTSLFIPELKQIFLASPSGTNREAQLMIYSVK
ncbi:MAG: YncE family protein [Bacteroidetes bacterium]|nr:YncE family protein [Bacteroidota bacterium]